MEQKFEKFFENVIDFIRDCIFGLSLLSFFSSVITLIIIVWPHLFSVESGTASQKHVANMVLIWFGISAVMSCVLGFLWGILRELKKLNAYHSSEIKESKEEPVQTAS